jgi:actin-related protein
MTEIMFTRFRVQSLGICSTSVLALFSTGRTRGVVVDVGDGLTSAVPVFEGYALPHAIKTGNIAGKDVTDIILNSLAPDVQPTQIDLARKIKEQMVIVPANYEEALSGPDLLSEELRSFELPGERIIQINKKAQLDAAEVLFNPAVAGLSEKSVPELALDSILKCDNDLRNNLFANIVLAGGTTMMAGFVERFEQEILSNLPPEILQSDVHILADSFREHAAWIGGSMLASLETWSKYMTITKDAWDNTEPDKRPSLVQKISF